MMRPGLQEMLAAAQAGLFDAVLTESIDRLSRDQEDIAYMHKRFRHRGLRIITLREDEISELHVGLKGTMSALYIKDLARRTHRGLQQRKETLAASLAEKHEAPVFIHPNMAQRYHTSCSGLLNRLTCRNCARKPPRSCVS